MTAWLNGEWTDAPMVAADDRGLLLGDGAFATLRVVRSRPLFWERHWARLAEALDILAIPTPFASEALEKAAGEIAMRAGLDDAAVRLTITRGGGVRGLAPPDAPRPTALMTAHPRPPPFTAPATTVISSVRRLASSPLTPLKTLGYAENILALKKARAAGMQEAILSNEHGRLVSTSMASLFLIDNGVVAGVPKAEGARDGVAKSVLKSAAVAIGAPYEERPIAPETATLSFLFAANAVRGPHRLALTGARPANAAAEA
ncbi:MAG: aminotransferase class IV, partial [Pseudomonadota bacterium]